jgi:hypothetical protein
MELEDYHILDARHLALIRSLLPGHSLLLAHSRYDGDKQVFSVIESTLNLGAEFTFRDLDVVLGITILQHQIEETIVNIDELVFLTLDIGYIHIVRGRRDIFKLLASEDLELYLVKFILLTQEI